MLRPACHLQDLHIIWKDMERHKSWNILTQCVLINPPSILFFAEVMMLQIIHAKPRMGWGMGQSLAHVGDWLDMSWTRILQQQATKTDWCLVKNEGMDLMVSIVRGHSLRDSHSLLSISQKRRGVLPIEHTIRARWSEGAVFGLRKRPCKHAVTHPVSGRDWCFSLVPQLRCLW